MKGILFVAAILASTTVIGNEANLYFGAKQEATCSIQVIKDNAPIFFEYNNIISDENFAKVDIKSDFAKKLTISSTGTWGINSAWGGVNPVTTLHVTTEGSIGNDGTTHVGQVNYEKDFEMNGQADQNSSFYMGVQAEKMTHQGEGRMDAVVKFFCE